MTVVLVLGGPRHHSTIKVPEGQTPYPVYRVPRSDGRLWEYQLMHHNGAWFYAKPRLTDA